MVDIYFVAIFGYSSGNRRYLRKIYRVGVVGVFECGVNDYSIVVVGNDGILHNAVFCQHYYTVVVADVIGVTIGRNFARNVGLCKSRKASVSVEFGYIGEQGCYFERYFGGYIAVLVELLYKILPKPVLILTYIILQQAIHALLAIAVIVITRLVAELTCFDVAVLSCPSSVARGAMSVAGLSVFALSVLAVAWGT